MLGSIMQSDFYHSGEPYLRVLQGLFQSLQNQNGIVQLLGSSGAGKSSLCRKLSAFLQRKDFEVITLAESVESIDFLHAFLAQKLDIPAGEGFAAVLAESMKSREAAVVLMIDDAHLLSDLSLFELLRLLRVCQQSDANLQLLFVSEQNLESRIQSNQEFAVDEMQLSAQYELLPMTPTQVENYVSAFFEFARRNALQLAPDAQEAIYSLCKGYPGPARKLLAEVLQWCSAHPDVALLAKSDLLAALENQNSEILPPSIGIGKPGQGNGLIPVAAVLMIASVAFLFQQLNSREESADFQPGPESETTPSLADDAIAEPLFVDSPFADQLAEQIDDDAANPVAIAAELEQATVPELVADNEVPENPVTENLSVERQALALELARQAALQEQAANTVSDSGLALVTAAERGIAPEEFALPEFETLLSGTEAEPDAQNAVQSDQTGTVAENLEMQAQAMSPGDLAGDAEVASRAVTISEPEPEADDSKPLAELDPATGLEEETSPAVTARRTVDAWVEAWETQLLPQYFALYHEEFEPRYHGSRSAWQNNRERVIGNANYIDLEIREFEILSEENDQIEVQFWLSYESASYRDETLKKLVLVTAGTGWQILEEVNIEVRVLSG